MFKCALEFNKSVSGYSVLNSRFSDITALPTQTVKNTCTGKWLVQNTLYSTFCCFSIYEVNELKHYLVHIHCILTENKNPRTLTKQLH